jgi:hypothetical protein
MLLMKQNQLIMALRIRICQRHLIGNHKLTRLKKITLVFNLINNELNQGKNCQELNFIKNYKYLTKDVKTKYFVLFKK